MRWRGRRQSDNIDDRRGSSSGGFSLPGGLGRGGMRLPTGRARSGGGIGLGTIVLVLVAAWAFGIDPSVLLGGGGLGPSQVQESGPRSAEEEQRADFVKVILADTEDTWSKVLPSQAGEAYRDPTLVLFSGEVRSACGFASSASGPFYCPGDSQVYIDLAFYDQLERQIGAGGDFAQAYVLAHEVGHHVQNLLGVMDEFNRVRRGLNGADANRLSVRIELQADCFAGMWANRAARQRDFLEPGDIEEGLNAASQIGDDTLQRRNQGFVVPESFNHGTSEQRMRWFRRGYEGGSIETCDTLNARSL